MKQGILLVDKPIDWTSFDCVNYIRRIVAQIEGKKPKQIKVGHSGTLDPFATGLLILLVGKDYTRQAAKYSKKDKVYEFSLILGSVSSTGDKTGELKYVSDKQPNSDQIKQAINKFIGEQMQTPPQFSAIKIKGQKAYELARAGKTVDIPPRLITVHELELTNYVYPELKLIANVSSGTYIRSLGEDIGKTLTTGGYVSELRRVSVGDFKVQQAIKVNEINQDNVERLIMSN